MFAVALTLLALPEAANTRPSIERKRIVGGSGIVVERAGYLCMHAGFGVGAKRKISATIADGR